MSQDHPRSSDHDLVGGLEHVLFFHSVVNFIIPFDELIFFHRGRHTTNTSIIEYNGWNICNHYGDLWNPKMGIIWAIFGVNVAKYSSTMVHIW